MVLFDILFYFVLSFIAYLWPYLSIYCIPLICYKNSMDIINKRKWIIVSSHFLFFFFFTLGIVFWCYFYKDCSIIIFIYFFNISILMVSIIFCIVFLIKKSILYIDNDNIKAVIVICGNTLLHYILYYIGELFTPGCVFPIYLSILPLSFFGFIGLPLFSCQYPFLYFLIYQVIIYGIMKNKFTILLYFLYSVFCFLNIPKIDYYWDIDINLSFNSYLYQDKYIFPEHMFFINSIKDIESLVALSHKESKEIIAGIGWYERINEQLIEKNGVIVIKQNGVFNIHEKDHYLRFCETGNASFYIVKNKNREIYICSEFFLSPIQKINKSSIIVASTQWTKTNITFFYKNIMRRIYDIICKSAEKK